jgi:hypothetical protein
MSKRLRMEQTNHHSSSAVVGVGPNTTFWELQGDHQSFDEEESDSNLAGMHQPQPARLLNEVGVNEEEEDEEDEEDEEEEEEEEEEEDEEDESEEEEEYSTSPESRFNADA